MVSYSSYLYAIMVSYYNYPYGNMVRFFLFKFFFEVFNSFLKSVNLSYTNFSSVGLV